MATSMRAVILTSAMLAGDAVGRHACDLARTLQTAGYQVQIWHEYGITRNETDILALCIPAMDAGDLSDADLVILEYAGWFPLAERIREATGKRMLWYHGVTPPELWGSASDRELLEISIFKSRLVWACNLAVADSPFGAEELSRHAGFPRELIAVVPIGVDTAEFDKPIAHRELAALRRKLELEDRGVILYIGRLAGNKRLDLLVQALFLLRSRHPKLHLVMVGDDRSSLAYRDCAQRIRDQAADLRLSSQITITGKVPDVRPYYQLADVFALASDHEGFGIPLVEAMASGVPVVASDAGALPWVIGTEDDPQAAAGVPFRSGSAEDLARAIASILESPDCAHALQQRGRCRASQFGLDRFRQETLSAIYLAEQESIAQPLAPMSEAEKLLAKQADIALRQYRVRSRIPVLGPLIQWLRINLTTHVKEAYLDLMVERQVIFNSTLLVLLQDMHQKLNRHEQRIASLEAEILNLKQDSPPILDHE